MSVLRLLNGFPSLKKIVVQAYDGFQIAFAQLRLMFQMRFKHSDSHLFFFFPYYHTGGAEKVHLQITESVKESHPTIFFCAPSFNNAFRESFNKNAKCINLYPLILKPGILQRTLLQSIVYRINKTPKATVFSSNCQLYYTLIPRFSSKVTCIDLIHAFVHKNETGAEHWSLPVAKRLNKRVVITEATRQHLIEQYSQAQLPEDLATRITCISNYTNVPKEMPVKQYDTPLKIMFVGRNSPEKRIALIGSLAEKCSLAGLPPITMIGDDLQDGVPDQYKQYCHFMGNINDEQLLAKLYSEAHVLLLLSSREGMPLVIMEAMAHGTIPISTNVGGIAEHVIPNETGFLVASTKPADIVNEAVVHIVALSKQPDLLQRLSVNTYTYAQRKFSKEEFTYLYQNLLR